MVLYGNSRLQGGYRRTRSRVSLPGTAAVRQCCALTFQRIELNEISGDAAGAVCDHRGTLTAIRVVRALGSLPWPCCT